MNEQGFRKLMSDQTEVHVHRWLPEEEPSFVLLIAHGMGEHGRRYAGFARWMNGRGAAVYAPDHRGHGMTAVQPEQLGHIDDHEGWELLVEDLHALSLSIRSSHPGLPLFLLGHSMGSLLSRRFIQRFPHAVDGVILSATGGDPGLPGKLGLWIARREIRRRGVRTPSALLKQLLFGGFNRRFRPRRTGFEWLNRDEREVQFYMQDHRIVTAYSAGFFRDLIGGTLELHRPSNMAATPRDLPMLFISGAEDPLGGFTRDVIRTFERYKEIGCTDVTIKLYPGARHELLLELNREEVYGDIAAWIDQRK